MTLATLKSACLSTKKQGVSYPVLPIDEFKSRHSDQVMIIRTTLSKLVMCSDLSFLLKMFYSKQRQGQFLSLPLFIFYTIMIKMGTF